MLPYLVNVDDGQSLYPPCATGRMGHESPMLTPDILPYTMISSPSFGFYLCSLSFQLSASVLERIKSMNMIIYAQLNERMVHWSYVNSTRGIVGQ